MNDDRNNFTNPWTVHGPKSGPRGWELELADQLVGRKPGE